MVGHNEAPRDSIDSSFPQMADLVPADGSLFRPSHARQSSNPNVFSDDYTIDSIDAPLFSNHQRSLSSSSLDSASTIEPRYHTVTKPGTQNATRTSLLDQQRNQPTVASARPSEESLPLERTVSHNSDATTPDEEDNNIDSDLDPFADEPTSSHATATGRPSSIRKDFTPMNRLSVVSTTSTRSGYNQVPRAMSPYRGATGPSHPYAMYPQVGVSRTASVATVSSIRPTESAMQARTAPQHPYRLYPQNVDYEEDLGDQPIPVGFSATHQSRSAQADEVGDIVGPDGHLEQLPPYSRYPDGVSRPTSGRGPASIASDIRGQSERYRDDPSDDAPGSRSDSSSGTLINVDSSDPLRPSGSRSDRSSTLVESVSEKVSRKGREKCWGAPIWLVVLAIVASVTCAILGGVIGGVLGEMAATHRQQMAASRTASVVTVTYTSDVSPYTSSPTNLAALPTGNYQIPWSTTNVSKFCVDTSEAASWSCQVLEALPIAVQGVIESSSITINETPSVYHSDFNYGAQLPFNITPAQQNLSIMIDKEDPQLGPALFFQTLFNKLVIVEDSQNIQSKRAIEARDSGSNGAGVQSPNGGSGAKPWFCWWNQTQIETFIYINQTQGSQGSADGGASSGGTTSSASSQAVATTAAPATTSTAGSGQQHKRDNTIAGDYPRKIKIKENRVDPNAPQAYCQQMQVNADNTVTPIQGQYFKINETITTTPYSKDSSQVPCYCEWFN